MAQIQIYSPDGFPIYANKTFSNMKEAQAGFDKWKERFEYQGYYSSVKGRISLDDLQNNCEFSDEEEPLSECCGAPLLGNETDPICSECREHV